MATAIAANPPSKVRPLRILMLTPEPPSPHARGGRPQATAATLASLGPRHHVTLVTQAGGDPDDTAAIERWSDAGVEVHVAWWPRPSGLRLQARRLDLALRWLLGADPWKNVLYADPVVQEILDAVLDAERFDVVLVEDNVMAGYRFGSPVPKVLTEHEVRRSRSRRSAGATLGGLGGWLRELDWGRWRSFQARTWPRFDRVQVFTPADKAVAASLAPELGRRLCLNPLGIEVPDRCSGAQAESIERHSLVFVGALSHQPNVDAAQWLARDILPAIRLRRPEATLTIVGQSPPASIRALQSENVDVTGTVPDVAPYLDAAEVVLAPVRIGGGLRTKVLQAMAHAKPVVTTTRGAEGIGNGHRPPLIVADTAQAIADVTVELLGDAAARHDLGERARAFVEERHSPAAYGARLEAILAEVVAPAPATADQ